MAEEPVKKGEIIQANTTIYVLQQRIELLEKELEQTKTKYQAISKQSEEQKTKYVKMTFLTARIGRYAVAYKEATQSGGRCQEHFERRTGQMQRATYHRTIQAQFTYSL